MRNLLGALFILAGVACALWLGVWWGLVGGIVALANVHHASMASIGLPILRIIFFESIGGLPGGVLWLIGWYLIMGRRPRRRART